METINWMILQIYCDSTGTHAWMLSRLDTATVADLKNKMQEEIAEQIPEDKEYATIDKTSTIWTAGGHPIDMIEMCGDEIHLLATRYIEDEVTREEVVAQICDWIDSDVQDAISTDNSGE